MQPYRIMTKRSNSRPFSKVHKPHQQYNFISLWEPLYLRVACSKMQMTLTTTIFRVSSRISEKGSDLGAPTQMTWRRIISHRGRGLLLGSLLPNKLYMTSRGTWTQSICMGSQGPCTQYNRNCIRTASSITQAWDESLKLASVLFQTPFLYRTPLLQYFHISSEQSHSKSM